MTGLDAQVKDFVMEHHSATEFVAHCSKMLSLLLPHYQKQGKAYLTVALGCTGGQHRSVSVARALLNHCKKPISVWTFATASFERFQTLYIIVATHGNLGTSLVDTALTVLGGWHPTAVGLTTSDSFAEFESSLSSGQKSRIKGSSTYSHRYVWRYTGRIGMTLHETGRLKSLQV